MKCEIIRDLLPSYIEKLTSPHSNEEIEKHLQSCDECRSYYNEMTKSTDLFLPVIDKEEVKKLNFLKKVKSKNKKTIILSISIVLILIAAYFGLFAIGFPVSSKDIDITYKQVDGYLKVDLTLKKNGFDLLTYGDSKFIYDENDQVIGYEYRHKPKAVLHNPLDNVGNEFMLGTQLNAESDYSDTLIIEFKDKTMRFVDGVLVE